MSHFLALRKTPCALLCATIALTVSTLLSGCSGGLSPTPAITAVSVTGNWQFTSTATAAATLPSLSGSLTGSGANIAGIIHSDTKAGCISPATPIAISGSTSAQGITTLAGQVAGGMFTMTGTLAADGRSLSAASYTVSGGTCTFPAVKTSFNPTPDTAMTGPTPDTAMASATAQSYSSITGTYTGGFSDSGGNVINISASLTQTPSSDTDGNFQLSGTGSFGTNPCFNSPVTVSNTQVTGGSFTLTYTDSVTTNSVTASGTFSTDGTTLTVTNFTLTGPCGPDSGTGLLTKQ